MNINLLLVLILLVMVAVVADSVFSIAQMSTLAEHVMKNMTRMDLVTTQVERSLVTDRWTGVKYAPAGVQGQNYMELPDIDLPNVTPWGVPYQYCPYAPGQARGSGTTVAVAGPGGFSYNVEVSDGKVVGSDQSLASVAASGEILALIVSPETINAAMPDCDGLSVDKGIYKISGGIVRAVKRPSSFMQISEKRARVLRMYVTPDGTGSGSSMNNPINLTDALEFFRTREPSKMEIVLAAGTHKTQSRYFDGSSAGSLSRGTLMWRGLPGSNIEIVNSSGGVVSGDLLLSGDHIFNAIDFNTGSVRVVVKRGSKLRTKDTIIGSLLVEGGTVFMDDGYVGDLLIRDNGKVLADAVDMVDVKVQGGRLTSAGTSTWTARASGPYVVEVYAGEVIVEGDLTLVTDSGDSGVWVRTGGRFVVGEGASLQASAGTGTMNEGVYVYAGGEFVSDGGYVSFPSGSSAGFNVEGVVRLSRTNIHFGGASPYGVRLFRGAELTNTGGSSVGVAGGRPVIGVAEVAPAMVYGEGGRVVASGDCWGGALFDDSHAGNSSGHASRVITKAYGSTLSGEEKLEEARLRGNRARNNSNWACIIAG